MFGTQKLAPMLRRAKNAFVFERSACLDDDDDGDLAAAATEDEEGSREGIQ